MAMKKRSFQLSQKQRLREMGSGQERQLTKEEMEARKAAWSAAKPEGVCVGLGCRGPECDFVPAS